MACAVLKQLTICVLFGMIQVGVWAGTLDALSALSECASQRNKSDISFTRCAIRNFKLHLPINSKVDRLTFRGVKVLDVKGCIDWMNKLPVIGRQFSVKPSDGGDPTEGLANCLSGLNSSLQYADVSSDVTLEGLHSVDEEWLNKHGYTVYGGLTNKTVAIVRVVQQDLVTANTQKYLQGVRITDQLHLMTNKIEKIEPSDFSLLDLSKLRSMCFKQNQICVIHLAAFRNLTSLSAIQLESNPCYVPSRTFLSWKNSYPDAIVYAKTEDCEKFKPQYCTVLKEEVHTDTFGDDLNHEIMLVHPSCSPQLPVEQDSAQSQDFTALIAVLSCCAFVLLVAFIYWRRSKLARSKSPNAALEDAVRFQRERDNAQKSKDDRFSGTYEVINEPVYTEIDENRHSTSYAVIEETNNVYDEPNHEAPSEAANEPEPDDTQPKSPVEAVTFDRTNDYKPGCTSVTD